MSETPKMVILQQLLAETFEDAGQVNLTRLKEQLRTARVRVLRHDGREFVDRHAFMRWLVGRDSGQPGAAAEARRRRSVRAAAFGS